MEPYTWLFAHSTEETEREMGSMAEAAHASPLPLKRRGLRRANALFCQPCEFESKGQFHWAEDGLQLRDYHLSPRCAGTPDAHPVAHTDV
jgi:hypothetical protein